MNSLNFTGNIGRDAEIRYTAKQEPIVSFSVALSSGYGDKAITTWLNCTGFGARYEKVAPYLVKGSQVGITGEFQARPYTTKEGVEKLSLEVRIVDLTLLGSRKDADGGNVAPQRQESGPNNQGFNDFEEEIPFN